MIESNTDSGGDDLPSGFAPLDELGGAAIVRAAQLRAHLDAVQTHIDKILVRSDALIRKTRAIRLSSKFKLRPRFGE